MSWVWACMKHQYATITWFNWLYQWDAFLSHWNKMTIGIGLLLVRARSSSNHMPKFRADHQHQLLISDLKPRSDHLVRVETKERNELVKVFWMSSCQTTGLNWSKPAKIGSWIEQADSLNFFKKNNMLGILIKKIYHIF